MATSVALFSPSKITDQDLDAFIQELGGRVSTGQFARAYIERGDGIVWFNIDPEELGLSIDEDRELFMRELGCLPDTAIILERTIGKDAVELLKFCIESALKHWRPAIVMSGEFVVSVETVAEAFTRNIW